MASQAGKNGYRCMGNYCASKNAVLGFTKVIEYCAELYYRTKSLGNPVILDGAEMTMMKERFKNYGQRVNNDVKI